MARCFVHMSATSCNCDTQKFRTDDQFLDSANGVAVFLEEKAMDGDNKLQKPKQQAVNKIGHAMHDLDPVFRQFSRYVSAQGIATRALTWARQHLMVPPPCCTTWPA